MTDEVGDRNHKYNVQVAWPTVVPLGDTLAVNAAGTVDQRWAQAFEVVLDEYGHQTNQRKWGSIDFEFASDGTDAGFVFFVRQIQPETRSFEVRNTVEDLVKAANTVAHVGTHVYELARELREAETAAPRGSVPPPAFDPLEDELDATAA
jgi:hypothetical protein